MLRNLKTFIFRDTLSLANKGVTIFFLSKVICFSIKSTKTVTVAVRKEIGAEVDAPISEVSEVDAENKATTTLLFKSAKGN